MLRAYYSPGTILRDGAKSGPLRRDGLRRRGYADHQGREWHQEEERERQNGRGSPKVTGDGTPGARAEDAPYREQDGSENDSGQGCGNCDQGLWKTQIRREGMRNREPLGYGPASGGMEWLGEPG